MIRFPQAKLDKVIGMSSDNKIKIYFYEFKYGFDPQKKEKS